MNILAGPQDFDGFYVAYVTGAEGQGFAMLVLREGLLSGADPSGVTFDGHYRHNEMDDSIEGSVTVRVPPGEMVVQGVSSGPSGLTYEVGLKFQRDFDQLAFLHLDTPLGPVNLKLRRLRTFQSEVPR